MSDVDTQTKVDTRSGFAYEDLDIYHITLCDENHPEGNDLPCCNIALCGIDLTNSPWTDGINEIPCPLCFHTEGLELILFDEVGDFSA